MKVIKITGNTVFSERPATMFSVLYGNVPMTGEAYSLGRSSDRFGVPCWGNHFLDLDTFPNNRAPPLASSTLTPFV